MYLGFVSVRTHDKISAFKAFCSTNQTKDTNVIMNWIVATILFAWNILSWPVYVLNWKSSNQRRKCNYELNCCKIYSLKNWKLYFKNPHCFYYNIRSCVKILFKRYFLLLKLVILKTQHYTYILIFPSVNRALSMLLMWTKKKNKNNCTIEINNERYCMKIIILRHFQRSIKPLSL